MEPTGRPAERPSRSLTSLLTCTQPGPTAGPHSLGYNAGILSHEHFTPIPWSNRTFAAAW